MVTLVAGTGSGAAKCGGGRSRSRWVTHLVGVASVGFGGGCGEAGSGAPADPTLTEESDTSAPEVGAVADGLGADIDTQTDATSLSANWSGFHDAGGEIASYAWAIGTKPGGTEVQDWTTIGGATQATASGLTLLGGTRYYSAVRAVDLVGNESKPAVSDGTQIDPGQMATSVSQWGFTWTFAEPERVGQFCNGDWWVLGPVALVGITPATTTLEDRTVHGSMVNPVPDGIHGYDSTLYAPYSDDNGESRYRANLNVAIGVAPATPLVLPAGTSLISSESQITKPLGGSYSQIRTAAVLTVVATVPADDAFRPAYTGTDKTVRFRAADLDFALLSGVETFGDAPDLDATAARFERVWLDHTPNWLSRFLHPVDNMPDYGRDFTSLYGTGAVLAQLGVPDADKRDLVIRLVQIGIDHFGNVSNGCNWVGDGGHGSGRKFPILFAGALLHDPEMLGIGASHPSGYFGPDAVENASWFGEDCQTFVVQETSPDIYNWGSGNYASDQANLPEWGINHTTWIANDDSDWYGDSYRRCCTANAWVGQTLAALLMGISADWENPAYFDYMDRYMETEPVGEWTRSWDGWQEQMWDQYRPGL